MRDFLSVLKSIKYIRFFDQLGFNLMQNFVINVIVFFLLSFSFAQERNVNYDEDQVVKYSLPEILVTGDNNQIKSVSDWESHRRSEILNLFKNEVYGQMPQDFDKMELSIFYSNTKAMDGKAHLKEVQIEVFKNNKSVQLSLVLFVPLEIKKPAPVFLLINNRNKRNTAPMRDTISEFWPAEEVIKAGYAVASFQVDDAAPDKEDAYTQGVLQLYPEQLQKKNGMKAIGAWAWAASRIMDYFEEDNDIDASEAIVVGHSRGGKAALWAAAVDERFAICISNNSGNTGAALSRRNFGETVKIINTSFPHWFNQNYKKYNDNEQNLPVDQHMLIALMAPRPFYATNASNDLWADPKGTFIALKEAEKVYNLYDLQSTLPEAIPTVDAPIVQPPLGYHLRQGEHDLTSYDWNNFIKFADQHFLKKN